MRRMVCFFVLVCVLVTSKAQTYLMDIAPVNTCGGIFYDSGGSGGSYGNSQNIVKVFTPSVPGQGIILTFLSFNTQAPFDYLEIYDGPTTSDPQIGSYTGNFAIGTISASVNNPTGQLTVRFVSNGAGVSSGWEATVSCGAKGLPQYCMNNQTVTVCNGLFTDSGGPTLTYQNSQSFTKTFYPATPGFGVSMSFQAVDIEQYFDQLEIFDGPTITSPLICVLSGTSAPFTITAGSGNTTGALTARFVSNGAVMRPGWTASLTCAVKGNSYIGVQTGTYSSLCNAIITDSGGQGGNYGWQDNETATYCPPPGQCAMLSISGVSVEPLGDVLSIHDGPNTGSPLLATYHNSNSVPGTFVASNMNPSGCLTLRFIEDGWTLLPGWSSTLSCIPCTVNPLYAIQAGTIETCNAFYSDNGGPFGDYLDMQDVVQTICPTGSANPYVRIDFTNFNLETNYDLLRIYNGPNTSYPLMGTATGNLGSFFAAATNSTGCLTLRFTSDFNSPLSGWTGSISCINQILLPVELTDFSAEELSDGSVKLSWKSESEVNVDFYEVQKSNDGIHFHPIGKVSAKGKSASYVFTDKNASDGINYYRLRIVDHDKTEKKTKILAVFKQSRAIALKIAPNPCNDHLSLMFGQLINRSVEYKIVNTLGEVIIHKSQVLPREMNYLSIDVSALPEGVYFLEVFGDELFTLKKIIVDR